MFKDIFFGIDQFIGRQILIYLTTRIFERNRDETCVIADLWLFVP